ncbi:MAG: sugar phosphate isomerase/epimerase [Bacteroidota bacterium]
MSALSSSRRSFLRLLGISAIAGTLSETMLHASVKRKARLGIQLYTVRKAIETDFDSTIRRVAKTGFSGIETYALPESVSLDHAAKTFKSVGLQVLGMHVELPVGDKRETALRQADAYECDRVIYPGWPESEKYKGLDAIKHTIGIYNETAAFLKTRGLRFGLHNHWWEFENTAGFRPFYYLLKHVEPSIFFEIDTYWAKTAGGDPAKIVHDFGKRAPLLHIKDGPAVKGDAANRQVPAGEGVMDFGAIATAGAGNTEWWIVEFDEYDKDIFDGIRQSYQYLSSKGYAVGKV